MPEMGDGRAEIMGNVLVVIGAKRNDLDIDLHRATLSRGNGERGRQNAAKHPKGITAAMAA